VEGLVFGGELGGRIFLDGGGRAAESGNNEDRRSDESGDAHEQDDPFSG
jgi:hypothetical protein